ncbi:hypothetical protein GCM10027586_21190 [Kineococcus gypseus]|uniref:hypothetical protein n=1 Tax=Kineococcus gypseus TaxID=1637102 RepID=UPI003D7D13C7
MAQKVSHNRVHGERLWDEGGQVWQRSLGSWLSAAEVDELVRAGHPVVVQSFEGPMRWLTPQAAREEWARVRGHFQQPGASGGGAGGAVPDARGRVYAGIAWHRQGQVLVGLQESC